MKKTIKYFAYSLLIFSFLQISVGCKESADGSATSPSTGDGDTPVDDTPIGEVEATGFWVNVQSDQYDVLIDNGTGYDTDCFIDKDSTTNEKMNCYIDVLEGDLYMQDIDIQYNVPPSLCSYLRITPAWHWNESPGSGPTVITIEEDNSGADPVQKSCSASHENLGTIACNVHTELTDTAKLTAPTCIYDRSAVPGGNNCCFGSYTFNYQEDTDNDGNGDTFKEPVIVEWGGSASACISPYLNSSWDKFFEGYPGSSIQAVPKDPSTENPVGLNIVHKLTSNSASTVVGFSTHANFYETTGSPHTHTSVYSGDTSILPYAVDPIEDLSGTAILPGTDSWRFTCLDEGFEVKHQIHLYLREWNTLVDFVAYQTSEGLIYDPDVIGSEGTDCDYDGTFGDGCNDLFDFGDILTGVGGSYPTGVGAGEATIRRTYFPNIDY